MLKKIWNWVRGKSSQSRCCCFHFGRCGSTVLGSLLNSHPHIEWHNELFHAFHENTTDLKEGADPRQLLLHPMGQSNSRQFGFETKFQHLDENGLNQGFGAYLDFLVANGFDTFLILRRSNYLKQAIQLPGVRNQRNGIILRTPRFQRLLGLTWIPIE